MQATARKDLLFVQGQEVGCIDLRATYGMHQTTGKYVQA